MNDRPPGIRRVCVALDAERSPGCGDKDAESVDQRLASALLDACSTSGLSRAMMNTQSAGDAQVAVLPVGIDEPRAIASLVNGLVASLQRMNSADSSLRIRLRMAVHEGLTILATRGFTGRAVATARRLAGSEPLREALMANPDADLAVMLSSQVFDDVSQFGDPLLPAGRFRPAEITDAPHGSREVGWIYVPQRAVQ